MNKFERQSRHPADQQTLPEAIAGALTDTLQEVEDALAKLDALEGSASAVQ